MAQKKTLLAVTYFSNELVYIIKLQLKHLHVVNQLLLNTNICNLALFILISD